MIRLVSTILFPVLFSLGLSACHRITVTSDPYYRAWYDVYGNYCGSGYPTAGCNFYASGQKITMSQDPYYAAGISLYNDYWTYTDSYGYSRSYFGFAWLSSTGILYDQFGNALNEVGDTDASADVIAEAAAREHQVQIAVGKALSQKYALNEEKGIQISKTLQDWAKLGRDRARTDQDVADYSTRLFGVSATRAESALTVAMATRDQKAIEDLNVDVAAHWGTSPEVSKQILKQWYKDEARAIGY